jgi:hypothetical protein
MHGVGYRVLASAYSDPAKGGSGRDEPMLLWMLLLAALVRPAMLLF